MSLLEVAESQFGPSLGVSGGEARFHCPWHDDPEGKLYMNVDTGLYLCFSGHCGRKGKLGSADVDDELSIVRSMISAIENPTEVEEEPILSESYLMQFSPGGPYWHERGFTEKTVRRFQLSMDRTTHEAIIPLRAVGGGLLGVIRRRLDGSKPKYLHPKGFRTGRHLYGAHVLGTRTKVALVEGPLDAVACWDARVPALACFGARLTEGQVHLLRLLGVTTLVPFFDNDHAGRAAEVSVEAQAQDFVVLHGTWRWPLKDPGELRPDQRRTFYNTAEYLT